MKKRAQRLSENTGWSRASCVFEKQSRPVTRNSSTTRKAQWEAAASKGKLSKTHHAHVINYVPLTCQYHWFKTYSWPCQFRKFSQKEPSYRIKVFWSLCIAKVQDKSWNDNMPLNLLLKPVLASLQGSCWICSLCIKIIPMWLQSLLGFSVPLHARPEVL